MCVIVHKKPNIIIQKKILRECWNKNPHGAGMMWADNGKLYTEKGFMTFDLLWERLSHKDFDPNKKELLIHFRFATSGLKTGDLCHPFVVNPNLAFMHNGILHNEEMEDFHGIKSDTQLLCYKILKQLPTNFLNNHGIRLLINHYLEGSTVVFMDAKGNITKLGSLDDEMETDEYWFSNYFWGQKLFQKTISKITG